MYAVNVTPEGIYVAGADEKALISGFIMLLDLIRTDNDGNLIIDCCEIRKTPFIKNRMAHFCVFPDTELWELEKFVRLCGGLNYTHIIIEFCGMLKYDCLNELSWKHAFTKDMLKPIIRTANDLGIEIIPMFNHWGHASQSRVMHGKQVVLDQNSSLQYLFNETGWCWNISNPRTTELLKSIRLELIELCGNGKYFHIGCDEAEGFSYGRKHMDTICRYINNIDEELAAMGRKTLLWADMLLYKKPNYKNKHIYANAKSDEAASYMRAHLNKSLITADWQYECNTAPIETSELLKREGFAVYVCPWDINHVYTETCIDSAKRLKLDGIIHTTWHTLSSGTEFLVKTAVESRISDSKRLSEPRPKAASFLRKTCFAGGDYTKSGWAKHEIGVLT